MTDEEPDFDLSYLHELGSTEQIVKIELLKPYGWVASHLWERSPGEIIVWCIARSKGSMAKTDYVHCYILPDGKVERWERK